MSKPLNELTAFMKWARDNDVDTTYLGAWTIHDTEEYNLKQIADIALKAWRAGMTHQLKEKEE